MNIANNTANCINIGTNEIPFIFKYGEIKYSTNVVINKTSQTTPNLLNENKQPLRRNNNRRRRNHQLDTLTHLFFSLTPPSPSAVIRTPTSIRFVKQPRRDQRPDCTKQRTHLIHVGRTNRGANHVWVTQH